MAGLVSGKACWGGEAGRGQNLQGEEPAWLGGGKMSSPLSTPCIVLSVSGCHPHPLSSTGARALQRQVSLPLRRPPRLPPSCRMRPMLHWHSYYASAGRLDRAGPPLKPPPSTFFLDRVLLLVPQAIHALCCHTQASPASSGRGTPATPETNRLRRGCACLCVCRSLGTASTQSAFADSPLTQWASPG